MQLKPPLLLSKHIFVCDKGDQAIFLDTKRDEYLAASGKELEELRYFVRGWGQPNTAANFDATVVTQHLKRGLLTADTRLGKPYQPTQLHKASNSLVTPPWTWPRVTPQRLRRFVRAWATVTLLLKSAPLHFILKRVAVRKISRPHPKSTDVEKLRELMMAYVAIQPGFFSPVDACLRNSLTLVEYLAFYDIHPDLVFGIDVDPFRAHAWVQQEDWGFIDTVEGLAPFSPIMVV